MSISRALNMCLDTIEEFFRKDKSTVYKGLHRVTV